eukprot:3401445-Ditylum_brightwellii.AAC.1
MSLMADLCKHCKRSNAENKQSTYKFKACIFSNRTTEDVLEWEKWLAIIIKNKPIKTAESKFDLVEAILKGNTLTHWQDFKCIKIAQISKNPDGTDAIFPTKCSQVAEGLPL